MARARKDTCTVTGLGTISCSRQTVTNPGSDINEPSAGQTVQGNLTVRGWYVDLAALSGSGIDQVHIHLLQGGSDQFVAAASYGQARSDIANAYGDTRFTNSGYTHTFSTASYANGTYTLRISGHSTVTGIWSWNDRQITINNSGPINVPPNAPNQTAPSNGSIQTSRTVTLAWSDTGDPDNGPRPYRDFEADIWKTDNSWRSHYNWQTGTNWTVTVPNDGTYTWQIRSGDGAAGSNWSRAHWS